MGARGRISLRGHAGRTRATPARQARPAPSPPLRRTTTTRDPGCHRGRLIANPIAREMARALGVVTCPDCHRTTAVNGRHGTVLRPPGAGWREALH